MMKKRPYQICTRCIMDTSDPQIVFDEQGICNHCHEFDAIIKVHGYNGKESDEKLGNIIEKIKKDGRGKTYDCILGISGGVDSAYLAHLAVGYGLRVLAVHVDAGWNSKIAVENIKKLCAALKIDLHTVVVDWETMKELQRAYMFSGLVNIDVPQDHAFLAAVNGAAKKNHVKYMLNGGNVATEAILPKSWIYTARDYVNLKSVYKECGRGKITLSKYPHTDLVQYFFNTYLDMPRKVNILNYVDYSKTKAMQVLKENYGWEYYGGKHFESIFTRFMQETYLPEKFGFNKKRAHLSCLVNNGEMTREEALLELNDASGYTEEQKREDKSFVLKKLDITEHEWEDIMRAKNRMAEDYKTDQRMMEILRRIKGRVTAK